MKEKKKTLSFNKMLVAFSVTPLIVSTVIMLVLLIHPVRK